MSSPPPFSERPVRPRLTLSVATSWIVILSTVSLGFFYQSRNQRSSGQQNPEELSLQGVAKVLVGIKTLSGQAPAFHPLSLRFRQILTSTARTPREQLEIVPVLAEVYGNHEALLELNRLEVNPTGGAQARDAGLFKQIYLFGPESLSGEQRISVESYGWFGQLGLSRNRPASDPMRRAVLRAALRMTAVAVVLELAAIPALGIGVVLLVAVFVLWAGGRLRSRLAMPSHPSASLLEAFAIYLAGFMILPVLAQWLFPSLGLGASLVAVVPVAVAFIWPRYRGSDWTQIRKALGWHRGRGILREIGAGVLGYIAGLPLLLGAATFVWLLVKRGAHMPIHPIVYQFGRDPFHMLVWTALACLWAPIVEETFFRGALYGYLRQLTHWAVAGVTAALLFAIIHPQGLIAVPLLATVGFVMSTIREWRGSLVASVTAHAVNNCLAVLLLFALT